MTYRALKEIQAKPYTVAFERCILSLCHFAHRDGFESRNIPQVENIHTVRVVVDSKSTVSKSLLLNKCYKTTQQSLHLMLNNRLESLSQPFSVVLGMI